MAAHGQSACIQDIHSDMVKRETSSKCSVFCLLLFNERQRKSAEDRKNGNRVAALNDQSRNEVY